MRKILYLIVGLICALPVKSQPDCLFTHYSSEEGLSQNTVMCILQDRKGNMWFATWDGINKFNGYVFRTYKAKFDNRINLTNNRADHMYEDKRMIIKSIALIPVPKPLKAFPLRRRKAAKRS